MPTKVGQRDARAGPELTGGRAVDKNGGERSRLLIVGTDCMGCARPVRPLPLPLSPPLSLPLCATDGEATSVLTGRAGGTGGPQLLDTQPLKTPPEAE